MSLEITPVVEPEYIRLNATGEYSFEKIFEFIELIKATADRFKRSRVLIDCRTVKGSMTETERFEGGQRIAAVFGARLKAALMIPANQVTKLGELTATNRGARFLVTSSEQEAMEWLLT